MFITELKSVCCVVHIGSLNTMVYVLFLELTFQGISCATDVISTYLRTFAIQKLQDKCEVQGRNLASLEERCSSLKSTIDQLNLALERANTAEGEMRAEIQSLQRTLLDTSSTSQSSSEKLKQVSCSFCDAMKNFNMFSRTKGQNLREHEENTSIHTPFTL